MPAVTLFMQGSNVELDENFNFVRQRINQAITATTREGEPKDKKDRAKPLHDLTFKLASGGQIAVNPEKIIAVAEEE